MAVDLSVALERDSQGADLPDQFPAPSWRFVATGRRTPRVKIKNPPRSARRRGRREFLEERWRRRDNRGRSKWPAIQDT